MRKVYGTVAVALMALGLLTATDNAQACLPPDPSWTVSESAPDEIPVGGALPFVMTGVETREEPAFAEGVSISVLHAEDKAVEGSTWTYELSGIDSSECSQRPGDQSAPPLAIIGALLLVFAWSRTSCEFARRLSRNDDGSAI